MLYTMDDIIKLLTVVDPEERGQLGSMIDFKFKGLGHDIPEDITKHLWWCYQTPIGFLTRTPAFDEMCLDVARHLKMTHLIKKDISCWELLSQIINDLAKKMWEEMTPDQRRDFVKEGLEDEQYREAFGDSVIDWTKIGSGLLLQSIKRFGGFATYRFALIITNQVARALLGRGLSLAANAALARGVGLFLGPVGWLLLAWGINDVLGTNYKKVVPATLYIYCLYERLQKTGRLPF